MRLNNRQSWAAPSGGAAWSAQGRLGLFVIDAIKPPVPASQTRPVSYRIGEAASGGMGAISQPANQSESGPGQNEKVSQRAFLDRCTPESGRCFERGERQLRATSGCEQMQ